MKGDDSVSDAPLPPGWYYGEGDPVGTKRYWDGGQWVGDPQVMDDMAAATGGPAVAGGKTLSSPGKRLGARFIDGVIIIVITTIVAVGIGGSSAFSGSTDIDGATVIAGLVGAVIAFLWEALFIRSMGATPGKLMLGMQVVDADSGDSPPADPTPWMRSANKLLGLIPLLGGLVSLVIGVVSLIFLFSDDEHRTVMDRIGGTRVVDK